MDFSNFLGTLERYLDIEFAAYTSLITPVFSQLFLKIEDTILDCNQSATNESIAPLLTTNNACGKRICVFLAEKSFCALLADAHLKEQKLNPSDFYTIPVKVTIENKF